MFFTKLKCRETDPYFYVVCIFFFSSNPSQSFLEDRGRENQSKQGHLICTYYKNISCHGSCDGHLPLKKKKIFHSVHFLGQSEWYMLW